MLKNKSENMTPFKNYIKIKRQNPFLLRLIWLVSYVMAGGKKCNREWFNMEGLKPPFLVLSEHQGFPDYYLTPLALYPYRATYVSDIEGFAAYGKWFYSQLGSIGTRRFTHSISLIQAILQVIKKNKDIIVIYPEACHCSVGVNSKLPVSVGKLAKTLKIPVVIQKMHGSYLTSPVWDEEHTRKVPLSVSLHKILGQEELENMTASQITEIINQEFQYDEYKWQKENKIAITYPKRAEGLHRVLYQCPDCKSEFTIKSKNSKLTCHNCKKQWEMNEYGQLIATDGKTKYSHIPDWYQFQKEEVHKEVEEGRYKFHEKVHIEALPSEKGFVDFGKGVLSQTDTGFWLTGCNKQTDMFFSYRYALHVEYNYRGKGDSIVLSTKDCCYYLYPISDQCNVTKVQFASEYMFSLLETTLQ